MSDNTDTPLPAFDEDAERMVCGHEGIHWSDLWRCCMACRADRQNAAPSAELDALREGVRELEDGAPTDAVAAYDHWRAEYPKCRSTYTAFVDGWRAALVARRAPSTWSPTGERAMDEYHRADARRAMKAAEQRGEVADSMEVRRAIVDRMTRGEITLEEGQRELARIKAAGRRAGKAIRSDFF